MKKEKMINRLSLFVAAFIFIIVSAETYIFYCSDVTSKVYLVFYSVLNGIRVFGLDSSIDMFDILKVEAGNVSACRSILNNIYIGCYFIAPIITVKFATNVVRYAVKEKLVDFNIGFGKRRLLIVGYNENVEKLLKNSLAKNKENKKFKRKTKILVLHRNEIADRQKFSFQISGISFLKYEKLDYNNEAERKMILKWMKPKKIRHIILFEEKGMDNVSNYCFFLKSFEQSDCSGFVKGLKIDCNYDMPQVENLIWDCNDKKATNFKYKMSTFSLPMLRAQSVLDEMQIYDNLIKENKDIHLMIVGFGKMGMGLFKRALNECVISENNNIVIDIFEKDIDKIKHYLDGINEDYYGEENTIYVGTDIAEGTLKIRFHNMDVNDKQFVERMESISQGNPFTYIAICVDRPEVSVTNMLCIERYLQQKNLKVPVLVRMDVGQQLSTLEEIYPELKLVPGDDEILKLETIHSKKLEDISNEIHKNNYDFAYNIESSKYRMLHYSTKENIYKSLTDADKEHLKKLFESEGYNDISKIREDSLLFRLGAIEHRRWSYYVILNGWSYSSEKDSKRKVTDCLCSFDKIVNDNKLCRKASYEYKDWKEVIINNKIGE